MELITTSADDSCMCVHPSIILYELSALLAQVCNADTTNSCCKSCNNFSTMSLVSNCAWSYTDNNLNGTGPRGANWR